MRQAQASSATGVHAAQGRAEAVLLERHAFERLLAQLSERMGDIAEPDVLARTEWALSRLLAFLDCDRCTFSEFVAGDYLNVLCSVGSVDFGALPRGRFQQPFRWFIDALRSGRIVALSNLPDELPPEAIEEAEHCRRTGLRSHISIPVRIGGRVTSVLSFAAVRRERSWPPEMVDRLRIVGDLIGSSVALARAEEEVRQLRHRIWHADRVQRVGALTAAIAHEVNQPLAAILSNAQAGLQYLARGDAAPEAIRDILGSVVREGKRAAETIRTMRALIRRDETRRERIDLAAALGEAERLLDSEFAGHGVRLETAFDPACWVLADKVQMEQVGLNLLLNAAAAVRDAPPASRLVRLQVSRGEEGKVRMSVRDAGKGIAPQDLGSIFEPFWTTGQEGLGLGLAICRSIVEAHGGRIWAESNPEGGATFSVELPAAALDRDASQPARDEPMAAAAVPASQAGGEAVVCVIDDDPEVRGSLLRLLDGAGWRGVGYASAEEFLGNPPAGEPACILLDVQMPGLFGPQLHRRLLEGGCAPPVIFITGRSDVAAGVDAMKRGAADFLEKPVDGEVLLAALRRAVERHAGERRQALAQDAAKERIARLSPREREIMRHVVRGRLNKQIAADLLIAEQTVKQHRGRVMEKVGVHSVAELVRICEAAGLAAEPPLLQQPAGPLEPVDDPTSVTAIPR
ncbi:ATP-binding protein [Variovorax ginsengisoli]|uniref:histidine kinase n=1 Tax=Variovorax ginsengisoli TaxID=363844 RepID=A0ABT8S7D0_9BURK|nr:ATP-binding protein [Variovorax ginsengisoli]MDN8615029.1 ATP-binding protein [Variovorax ginsengisoli]MDO1534199.1 ATP-binding protein [Variovorax ginsengisoli]